jgi:hypothetical protein
MKTTVDIPDDALDSLLRLSGASTKKDAIITAIMSYNQKRQMEEVAKLAGSFRDFMTQDELARMRAPQGGGGSQ